MGIYENNPINTETNAGTYTNGGNNTNGGSSAYGTVGGNSSYAATNTGSTVNNAESGVPAQISVWTKVKNFLFKEITVTMTPKQAKVLKEVHDFWHQDVKDFLFQEIEIVDNITL